MTLYAGAVLFGDAPKKKKTKITITDDDDDPDLESETISQKALATVLMKEAWAAEEKRKKALPPGAKLEEPPTPDGGLAVMEMWPGTMAMLENDDMIHRNPDGDGYILLPKSGGLMRYTKAQAKAKWGTKITKKYEKVSAHHQKGLLPILGDTLDGALFGRGFGRKGSGGSAPPPAGGDSSSGEGMPETKLNLPPPPASDSKETSGESPGGRGFG